MKWYKGKVFVGYVGQYEVVWWVTDAEWDEGIGLPQTSGSYSFKKRSFLYLVSGRCYQHAAGECVQFLSASKLHWMWSAGHNGTSVVLLENTYCHLYFIEWHRGFSCLLRENASSHFTFGGSSVSFCLAWVCSVHLDFLARILLLLSMIWWSRLIFYSAPVIFSIWCSWIWWDLCTPVVMEWTVYVVHNLPFLQGGYVSLAV